MVFFVGLGEAQIEYYRLRRLQLEESRRAERKDGKPENAARVSAPKQDGPAGTRSGSAAGHGHRRPPRHWPLRVLSLAAGVLLACSTAEAIPCLPGYCGYFYAKNECSDPVRLAIYYDEWWGDWTFEGFYRLRPGQTKLLDAVVPKTLYGEDDFGRPVSKRIAVRVPLRTGTATYYYYAETTDGSRRVGRAWGKGGQVGHGRSR